MASKVNRKSSATAGRARPLVILSGLGVVAIAAVLRMAGQSPATVAADVPLGSGAQPAGNPGQASAAARMLPPVIVDWEPVLQRDLFDASLFAPPPPQTQPVVQAPVEVRPDLAKEYLADVRGRLTLQATMAGSRPTAIINGTTYGIGDVVGDSYTVRRIDQRRIVIARDGVEMEMTCE